VTSWSVRRKHADPDRRGAAAQAKSGATREFVIEESLGYLVNRAARVMAQQLGDELRPAGVGIGQWAVLMFLWAHDGMSQAELSRVVAIEPPTMVRTVDRMVRDGLVKRRPDPTDGRISRIHLTRRGRALRDELVPRAVAVNERTLARLGADQGRELVKLLTKIADDEQHQQGGSRDR
jgi:DNA-binding MarR family transcriptional regulator